MNTPTASQPGATAQPLASDRPPSAPPSSAPGHPHRPDSAGRARLAAAALTFTVIAVSSLLFCSKGVIIKLGYREGLDTLTVLALRNLLSLPFFVAGLAWSEWRARQSGAGSLARSDVLRVLGLGFLGYYLSSLINFLGLQHVSVGLERMILYTYPSVVLIGSAVFLGQRIRVASVAAVAVAYLGLGIGFWAELHVGPTGNLWLGSALVFASALTYATFTVVSGELVRRLGSTRLVSWALVSSAVMTLTHYACVHSPFELVALPAPAWKLGWLLAIFGTVLPSYLFGWGLKRAGATPASVIGMVGPVGTVAAAAAVLGEPVTALQLTGLALTLGGGVAMSLLKPTRAPASPPRA